MDDRRTVVFRGLDGQVPREVLPDLVAPLLTRLSARFDRFGGPAAASAVILLKSESHVRDVIKDFEVGPIAVVLVTGADPVPLKVTARSPPHLRRWNGFTGPVC